MRRRTAAFGGGLGAGDPSRVRRPVVLDLFGCNGGVQRWFARQVILCIKLDLKDGPEGDVCMRLQEIMSLIARGFV